MASPSKQRLDKYIQLREAIKKGDQATARQLILNNAVVDLNQKSSALNSLLHWAITQFQDTEIIEILLDKKANVHAKNHYRQSPLYVAVQSNKTDVVKLLLNKGAHVGDDLKALIHVATVNKNELIVKLLVDYGVVYNTSINLKNSLSVAVEHGQPKIVESIIPYCKFSKPRDKLIPKDAVLKDGQQYKECINLLLQHGFTISPSSKNDSNFVYTVIEKGYSIIIEELMKLGVNANMIHKRTGLSLLHTACLNKHHEIVEILIKYKAEINLTIGEQKLSRKEKLSFEKIMDLIGKTPLYIAVNNSDVKTTKLLLDNGANLNNDPNYFSIINLAMQKESKEIVEILLEHGADVNAANAYGKNFLHYCAMWNLKSHDQSIKHEIAELLLKKGANVNAQTQIGNTPLFDAIQNGYIKVVEVLLKYNADVQHKNIYGNTPLHIATGEFALPGFVEILLDNNADVNVVNENGMTPLHTVCLRPYGEDVATIEKLLQHKADINCVDKDHKTPLNLACEQEYTKLVQVFLDNNAMVNLADKNGQTPLHKASEKKNIDIIEKLLKNKADPNVKDKEGKTPLHIVSSKSHEKILDVMNILLQYQTDINVKDLKGRTPLFNACEEGNIPIIKFLLDNNAEVNYADIHGTSPLFIAAKSSENNSQIVELLLEHKASIFFVDEDEKTFLHVVAEQNLLNIIERLIKMNININSMDNQGRTALHIATEKGYKEMVKSLIKYGADVNILSKNKETSLHYAFNCITHLRKQLFDHHESLRNFFYERILPEDLEDEKISSYMCEIYSYKEIVKILKEHIIKLKCAKLPVNEVNLSLIDDYLDDDDDDDDDEYHDELEVHTEIFEDNCRAEISQLKTMYAGQNSITLYDILTKNIQTITRYIRNENFVKCLTSNIYDKKFPLYIEIIKSRFAEAVIRNQLLEMAQKYSAIRVFRSLPHNCIDEVFSYLEIKDLKRFIHILKLSKNSDT